MNAPDAFFDSNVILYMFSSDAAKAQVAEDIVASGGRISVQVLNEIANVARRKMRLRWREVIEITTQLSAVCVVDAIDLYTHRRGLLIAERFELSVFDGMIVASALRAECGTLYSEDLRDGLEIDGRLTVRNPFRRAQ